MSTPKRPLSSGEARLWQHVTGDVKPLAGTRQPPARPPPKVTRPPPAPAVKPPPAVEPPPPGVKVERVRRANLAGLDRRNATRLRRGQRTIEGRLDLHGMTQAEAHRALNRFLAASAATGKRCVLVITGKGSTQRGGDSVIPERAGVLRDAVPGWLAEARNRALIVATHPAAPQHGGTGALYVLLRRQRRPRS